MNKEERGFEGPINDIELKFMAVAKSAEYYIWSKPKGKIKYYIMCLDRNKGLWKRGKVDELEGLI